MKAFWIAVSLGVMSSAALAQSASRTTASLDTCFKLVRVTEASCSPSVGATERQACLEDARKMQRMCLELAASQPSAPADQPPKAVEASPKRPVETVPPALPASPPVKTVEAPATVNVTTPRPAPPVAPGTNWTVSEMFSPVDYAPVVTATIRARSENRITPATLVVRCRKGSGELVLRMEGIPRPPRGGEVLVSQQLNDQPAVKSRWAPSADAKSAIYKGDAAALLQSLTEDARLKIVVSDAAGRDSEAGFQFAGWNAVRDKIAAACMWTSTASQSSEKR